MNHDVMQIRQWILERNKGVDDVRPDQDLIESRLVDSLSFVELLILIQHLSGETIDQSNLNVDDFRTLDSIAKRYFSVTSVD